MNNRKIISLLSLAAGICVLSFFIIGLLTGVSQEKFEVTQAVGTYTQNLIEGQNVLRLIFTIDIVFICLFSTLFVFITQYLKTDDRVTNTVANVAMVILLLMGILDFHEDLHILTMLHSAVNNLPIEQNEISHQMMFSALKFCLSYLGLFLLGFLLPSKTFTEKLLKYSILFFQIPVGALVYTAPENLSLIFNLGRFVFMVSGFFLLAYNFSQTEDEK